jgi:hypothetical protein
VISISLPITSKGIMNLKIEALFLISGAKKNRPINSIVEVQKEA